VTARRRRSRGRTRSSGRQGLWVRHETFEPTDVVTGPKYTEDAVIFPDLWQREVQNLVNPKKGAGGALMMRAFGSVMWEIRQRDFVNTIQTPNYEVLIFAASTEEPAATQASDFLSNLESQRILFYEMTGGNYSQIVANNAGGATRWYGMLKFDIKVKARLSGQDIVLSTRCSETETVDVSIDVRAQFSAYLTTP